MVAESLKPDGFDGKFSHIAIVVHNIEEAIASYCNLLKVDRPLLKMTGEPAQAKIMFMGVSTPARSYQAFFDVNGMRVELMQPDENRSTWRESLDKNGEGLHHTAYVVENMADSVAFFAKLNMPVVQTGYYNGGHYAYIDSVKQLGMMIELLCST